MKQIIDYLNQRLNETRAERGRLKAQDKDRRFLVDVHISKDRVNRQGNYTDTREGIELRKAGDIPENLRVEYRAFAKAWRDSYTQSLAIETELAVVAKKAAKAAAKAQAAA
jgi:hypothetical protein